MLLHPILSTRGIPLALDLNLEQAIGDWIFGDHIFNPRTLRKVQKPAPIDSISWELIVGRFATVVLEREFPDLQADLCNHETHITTQQGA